MSVDPYPTAETMAQPVDATLTALAALPAQTNTAPYFTGVDTAALMTVTPYARTLLDDTDQAAMWQTLGIGSGAGISATGTTDKVAVWQNATTLTSDVTLHWDNANDRLGIGTATPYAPLGFGNTLGLKISLYRNQVGANYH